MLGPQNEHSRVKEFTKLNSLAITTLPVLSLHFYTTKEQSLKLNTSDYLLIKRGNTFSLCKFDCLFFSENTLGAIF